MQRKTSGSKRVVATLAASALAATGLLVAGSGTAAAAPVTLTLDYSCEFPLIGADELIVEIRADVPETVEVGEFTPQFVIDTTSTVGALATEALNVVGAATLDGVANADAQVDVPQFTTPLPVTVPAELEQAAIPASGTFDVDASGTAPALVFNEPGEGVITVHDIELELAPRDADGNLTGLGEFVSQCTQLPGQDNVLATFEIVPATT